MTEEKKLKMSLGRILLLLVNAILILGLIEGIFAGSTFNKMSQDLTGESSLATQIIPMINIVILIVILIIAVKELRKIKTLSIKTSALIALGLFVWSIIMRFSYFMPVLFLKPIN